MLKPINPNRVIEKWSTTNPIDDKVIENINISIEENFDGQKSEIEASELLVWASIRSTRSHEFKLLISRIKNYYEVYGWLTLHTVPAYSHDVEKLTFYPDWRTI